jgi:sporulation protein YunB
MGVQFMAIFRRRGFKSKGKNKSLYLWVILIIAILFLIYYIFNSMLMPVMKTLAVNKADLVAVSAINNAASKVLKANSVSYDKLIIYQKDQIGDIIAVTTDALEVNKLKYDIIYETIAELNSIKSSDLKIPLGNALGGALFTNRGPNINVKLSPIGNVNANISSVFTSAGINQTRQQIMLNIKVKLTIILASYTITQDINSNLCIAESVIVGKVPNAYTNIEGYGTAQDKAIISNTK